MTRRPPPRKPPTSAGDEPPNEPDQPAKPPQAGTSRKQPAKPRKPPARPRPVDPWERQPDETDPAFEAFKRYRDMGATRSTAKVGRDLGKSKNVIDGWCKRHSWVVRVRGYDAHVDREWLKEQRQLRRKAAQRNASVAALAMQKFGQYVMALDVDSRDLKPGDMAAIARVAHMIEATALGLDAAVTGGGAAADDGTVDAHTIAGMSDEDRRARLQMLLREAQSRLDDSEPTDLDDVDEREAS